MYIGGRMEKDTIECIDSDPDIEKRRPIPFRYVTSLPLDSEKKDIHGPERQFSVMTDEFSQSEALRKHFESVVGIGDVARIETVLKRHELKRAKRE
jgi:hypothetical protein